MWRCSLYVEDIDVGEEGPRVVVSGLVKFKSVQEMLGARVVVVANMKPTALRGIRSHAMLLCASSPDGSRVCQPSSPVTLLDWLYQTLPIKPPANLLTRHAVVCHPSSFPFDI